MNRKASLHTSILSVGFLMSAAWAAPQQASYDGGYIRVTDGDVSVQRAQDPEPQPAEVNLPILPGDRLWTVASSFSEIRLTDGTIVRLGAATKVDFVAFGAEPTILLWNGSIIARTGVDSAGLRVDTPSGSVYQQTAGAFRVDVADGVTTTVSVLDGTAELGSEQGSVLVASGQRSSLEPGADPQGPFAFDATQLDELDSWSRAHDRPEPRRRTVELADVPAEVHHYVDDLSDYGTWREDETLGSVWYPTSVGYDWAPYRNGRWCYTSYGYTWVSYEPWGWAPSHYGRWGYGHGGWYWVPGRHWGPAWVSIAVGPTWVGWSPLGYHGGSVFSYNDGFYGWGSYPYYKGRPYYRGGKAVPRHVYDHGAGWNFSRKEHFGRRGKARLRAADVRSTAARARVHEQGVALDRSMTPHAIGNDNALARHTPRVRRSGSSKRSGLRATAGRTRGRAIERSQEDSRTVDRGAQRTFTETRSRQPSERAQEGFTSARTRIERSRVRSREARTSSRVYRAPAAARATGARGEPLDESGSTRERAATDRTPPTRTEPSRTQPTRTRPTPSTLFRSRSRTSGARDSRASEPRTRGQEFFESSSRRQAVQRTPTRNRERTSRGDGVTSNRGRSRSPNVDRATTGSGDRSGTTRATGSRQRSSGSVRTPRGSSGSSGAARTRGSRAGGSRSEGSRSSGTRGGGNQSGRGRRRN